MSHHPVDREPGFDALVHEERAALERYVASLGASPEDAEEIAATALWRAYDADAPRERRRLRSWLRTVSRNLLIDRHRRERIRLVPAIDLDQVPDGRDLSASAELADTARSVLSGMTQLTPLQRDVLYLRAMRGLSYAEIAEELGTGVGAVESSLHRGRRSLERALRRDGRWLPALVAPFLAVRRFGERLAAMAGDAGVAKVAVSSALVMGGGVGAVVVGGEVAVPAGRPRAGRAAQGGARATSAPAVAAARLADAHCRRASVPRRRRPRAARPPGSAPRRRSHGRAASRSPKGSASDAPTATSDPPNAVERPAAPASPPARRRTAIRRRRRRRRHARRTAPRRAAGQGQAGAPPGGGEARDSVRRRQAGRPHPAAASPRPRPAAASRQPAPANGKPAERAARRRPTARRRRRVRQLRRRRVRALPSMAPRRRRATRPDRAAALRPRPRGRPSGDAPGASRAPGRPRRRPLATHPATAGTRATGTATATGTGTATAAGTGTATGTAQRSRRGGRSLT